MSESTATLSPSLMSPIAMPATGSRIGTPASISDKQPPHTDAIDDDPFDSRISDTMRIVYGKSSYAGRMRVSARSASAPWPISRRDAERIILASPVEYGGEAVWRLQSPAAPP